MQVIGWLVLLESLHGPTLPRPFCEIPTQSGGVLNGKDELGA